MIEKTISEIETKVRGSVSVGENRKQELLDLISRLKTEIGKLETTHSQQADSIATLAHASTEHATSDQRDPARLENSVADLRSSVEGFEQSHPKLVQVIDNLSKSLASWGV